MLALGCAPKTTPVAYREHEDLALRLREARTVLEELTGRPLELWDSDPARTWADVQDTLEKAAEKAEILVPEPPSLWPWCNPKEPKTCVMPAVLFGAIAALALAEETRTLADVIADHGIDTRQDPWALLAQVGALVGSDVDAGVAELRDHLDGMWRGDASNPAPGRFIAELGESHPGSTRELVKSLRTPA